MTEPISIRRLNTIAHSASLAEEHCTAVGCHYLVVDCRRESKTPIIARPLHTILIGLGADDNQVSAFDLVTESTDTLELLLAAITAQPTAAYMLTQVLKHNARSNLMDGLLAESLAYSTLQSGSGFQAWLAQQAHQPHERDDHATLLISRVVGQLQLQFNRPAYHNAYNEALKDGLCEALQLAHIDDTITSLTLSGKGPSFCAGGDLTEFGQVDNPADAHISRTTRGAAALLGSLDIDTKAYVHGACIGAGIELPSFCRHISAHPDTFFQLPEVAMGLIPGAGGTVSVLNRIGRHNAALLALSNWRIDVTTALAWGLIDNITSEPGFDHASQ